MDLFIAFIQTLGRFGLIYPNLNFDAILILQVSVE